MKPLKFNRKFFSDIISGKKTTTVRDEAWLKEVISSRGLELVFGAGLVIPSVPVVFCNESGDKTPFGTADITGSRDINISEITQEIAEYDGFSSAEEMTKYLYSIYGEDCGDNLFIIRFKLNNVDSINDPVYE